MVGSPWLASWIPDPFTRPALLCLPSAGAGAGQFQRWQNAAGGAVSVLGVQLPGRERRWGEPPASTVDEAVRAVVEALTPLHPDLPLVVYGHSFGGLLGYEVVRALQGRGGRPVEALVVAACRPPHMWVGAGHGLLDDDEELARLLAARDLGAEDIDEDSREYVLDVLRQDARLSLSYRHLGAVALDCALHGWAGTGDDTVTPAHVEAWHTYTAAAFSYRMFHGGHYFPDHHLDDVVQTLCRLAGRNAHK